MRFLVGASLSPSVVSSLNDEGHDAVHVGDVLPLNAPDDVVFDAAVERLADELGGLVVAGEQMAVLVDGRLDRRVAGVAAHEEDRHAGRETGRLTKTFNTCRAACSVSPSARSSARSSSTACDIIAMRS